MTTALRRAGDGPRQSRSVNWRSSRATSHAFRWSSSSAWRAASASALQVRWFPGR